MVNHAHIVNASLQLVPVVTGGRHPYEWIDEVIDLIKASGVKYEIGPFNTSIECDYKSVMKLIDNINAYLLSQNCPEWLLQFQIQIRANADMTANEKTDKHR